MICFEFDSVFGDWWVVTNGRSPDDITYTVVTDNVEHGGGLYRLETLIALYECTILEIPTDEHPIQGGYTIVDSNGETGLIVDEQRYETSYRELRQTLATFLSDVFHALDRNSTPEQRQNGIDYLEAQDDLRLEFRALYTDLTQHHPTISKQTVYIHDRHCNQTNGM